MSQHNENVIQHDWGYELIWAKTEDYCGRIFYFDKKGAKTPFSFNSETDKTFFVSAGKFIVRWIETQTGNILQTEISEGQVWHCPKLQPSSFESIIPESTLNVVSSSPNNDLHTVLKAENF